MFGKKDDKDDDDLIDSIDELETNKISEDSVDNDFLQHVSYCDIAEIFESEGDDSYVLPKHHRCAAHTINLIATNVSKFIVLFN